MDEVFGEENFVAQLGVAKTAGATSENLPGVVDYVVWYAQRKDVLKFRRPFLKKELGGVWFRSVFES